MTAKKAIVDGDTEVWTDCPPPHLGGGTGTIHNTLNDFVTIENKAVIVRGQQYTGPDGCGGNAGTNGTSSFVTLNGTPIVLEGDTGSDGCHALLGAQSVQQDFVTVIE